MTPNTILVPIDFSVCSENALDYACMLAGKLGSTIHLVHVVGAGLPELGVAISDERLREESEQRRANLDRLADPRRVLAAIATTTVVFGDPRDEILAAAKRLDADVIVMGTHGRRGLSRAVLGSVTESVLRRAECPVVAVRTKKAGAS